MTNFDKHLERKQAIINAIYVVVFGLVMATVFLFVYKALTVD